jgi:hypothetical protein
VSDDSRSNSQLFLARIRDHYVDQLLIFIADQRRSSARGEAEVKIELEPGLKVFRSLGCADFVRNDGTPEIVEFEPERVLGFDPISTTLGEADLKIERLRWDDVIIDHNGSFDAEQALGRWFEKWFDPDDRRYRAGADLGTVIHSLAVEPGRVSVDFGSATPDAFWELLDLLEKAGATELRVGSSHVEAESS